jgi:hypothetical protein
MITRIANKETIYLKFTFIMTVPWGDNKIGPDYLNNIKVEFRDMVIINLDI